MAGHLRTLRADNKTESHDGGAMDPKEIAFALGCT